MSTTRNASCASAGRSIDFASFAASRAMAASAFVRTHGCLSESAAISSGSDSGAPMRPNAVMTYARVSVSGSLARSSSVRRAAADGKRLSVYAAACRTAVDGAPRALMAMAFASSDRRRNRKRIARTRTPSGLDASASAA